jgi:hypothetical protein
LRPAPGAGRPAGTLSASGARRMLQPAGIGAPGRMERFSTACHGASKNRE